MPILIFAGLAEPAPPPEYAYIFCGDGGSRSTDQYTPDAWIAKTDAPSPDRFGLAASTVNGKAYIYGGYAQGDIYDTDEYVEPLLFLLQSPY